MGFTSLLVFKIRGGGVTRLSKCSGFYWSKITLAAEIPALHETSEMIGVDGDTTYLLTVSYYISNDFKKQLCKLLRNNKQHRNKVDKSKQNTQSLVHIAA